MTAITVSQAANFLKNNVSFLTIIVLFLSFITIMIENQRLETSNQEIRYQTYQLHAIISKMESQMYWDGFAKGFDEGDEAGRQDEQTGRPDPT